MMGRKDCCKPSWDTKAKLPRGRINNVNSHHLQCALCPRLNIYQVLGHLKSRGSMCELTWPRTVAIPLYWMTGRNVILPKLPVSLIPEPKELQSLLCQEVLFLLTCNLYLLPTSTMGEVCFLVYSIRVLQEQKTRGGHIYVYIWTSEGYLL